MAAKFQIQATNKFDAEGSEKSAERCVKKVILQNEPTKVTEMEREKSKFAKRTHQLRKRARKKIILQNEPTK